MVMRDVLLAVISALITVIIGSIITGLGAEPQLFTGLVKFDPDQNKSTLKISNVGSLPITGLSLVLESPYEIRKVERGQDTNPPRDLV